MEISEKLVWVVKNYFLIIGVAAWFLIPYSPDLLPLLHRYSLLIPFALWHCKKKVAGSNGTVVDPQAAPASMASSVENFYDFLFFKPQEEEEQKQRQDCHVDEPSAASQGPAWWLREPVLTVGKETAVAEEEEFSWVGVADSTAWKGADVAPSAPPIATAYSASFFDECCGPPLPSKAEGGWEHNKSMEEIWKAICGMKEEKGRRRRVKEEEEEEAGGGRRKRGVPAVKKDELFRDVDAFIKKQRQVFEFDLQREESPVQRPRRAVEMDRRRQLPRP